MKLNEPSVPLSQQLDEAISRATGTKITGSQPQFALTDKLPTKLTKCRGELLITMWCGHGAQGPKTMTARLPLESSWIFRDGEKCLLGITGKN